MDNAYEYVELYHYDDKRSLVMNQMTGELRMMKKLTYFDINVYQYLAQNFNPHIPKIFSYQLSIDNKLVVYEEAIQGDTFDVIIKDRNMPDEKKISYFQALLEGLEFLHSAPHPIIHRDLKPANIMLSDRGEVVILDYDAAKIYKPDSSGDTTFLGTAGVAAPEQYGFMQSDPRSDIYAVGRMLADAFPGNERIQKIAAKAMSFDPQNRYSGVKELSAVLANKLSVKGKIKNLLPPPGFRTHKWWKSIIAILGYSLIVYLVVQFILTDKLSDGIIVLFSSLIALDIFTSWTGIFDFLPFASHKNLFLRFLFKTLFSLASFGSVMFIVVFYETMVGLIFA